MPATLSLERHRLRRLRTPARFPDSLVSRYASSIEFLPLSPCGFTLHGQVFPIADNIFLAFTAENVKEQLLDLRIYGLTRLTIDLRWNNSPKRILPVDQRLLGCSVVGPCGCARKCQWFYRIVLQIADIR